MKKKLATMTLAMLMVLSVTASALSIQPRWNVTNTCDATLLFSGTTATCIGEVRAISGSQVSGTMTLYRVSGSSEYEVDSWSLSGKNTVYVEKTCSVTKGQTYRLEVSVSVSNSNSSDKIKVDSSKTCK